MRRKQHPSTARFRISFNANSSRKWKCWSAICWLPDMVIVQNPPEVSVKVLLAEAGLPADDVTAAHLEHFLGAWPGSKLEGVVGVELYGTEVARESAPDAIRGTREFSAICPESAVFMVKHLLSFAQHGEVRPDGQPTPSLPSPFAKGKGSSGGGNA